MAGPVKTFYFICPTLCGCVLERTATWPDLDDTARTLAFVLKRAVGPAETGVTITNAIVQQCDEHAAFVGPDALWDELQHIKGNAHRPDTCSCSLAYWWDDREPIDERMHMHVEHPVHTARCDAHAHLEDVDVHAATVLAENVAKNVAVAAVATALGYVPEVAGYNDVGVWVSTPAQNKHVAPTQIPWAFDDTRALLIDPDATIKADRKVIDDALATVPAIDPAERELAIAERTARGDALASGE